MKNLSEIKIIICFMLVGSMINMSFGKPKEWALKPVKGNAKGWVEGENWKHSAGNPLTDSGAKWTLGYQTGKDPALEAEIKKMVPGRADNKYTMVWGSDEEKGMHTYKGVRLYAGCPQGARLGPATLLSFSPSKSATYTVALKGLLLIQVPEAGSAKLIIYTLNSEGKKPKVLDAFETEIKEGNTGKKIEWSKKVRLDKGSSLCFRIQTHNPGPGNGSFSKFSIENLVIKNNTGK